MFETVSRSKAEAPGTIWGWNRTAHDHLDRTKPEAAVVSRVAVEVVVQLKVLQAEHFGSGLNEVIPLRG